MGGPAVVAVVSDLHVGSTIGLCPPEVALDDGGIYRQSPAQAWLWEKWGAFWDRARAVSQAAGAETIGVFNGDLVDLDAHGGFQVFTRDPASVQAAALRVLEPALAVCERGFILRGTEAHAGKSAYLEEQLAKAVGAEGDAQNDTASWWWLPLEVRGVLFDFAHHPSTGDGRPWTSGGAANRIAAGTVFAYAARGERVPDLVVRSHKHVFSDSGLNYPCRAVITPAWQLATAFVHRIGLGSSLADVGGLLITVSDGRVENFEVVRFTPQRRETVSI